MMLGFPCSTFEQKDRDMGGDGVSFNRCITAVRNRWFKRTLDSLSRHDVVVDKVLIHC